MQKPKVKPKSKKVGKLTLQQLIDFAKKANLEPANCVLLLHSECMSGDIELDYFDRIYLHSKASVLNKDDKHEEVEYAIGVEQLWIPDIFGN